MVAKIVSALLFNLASLTLISRTGVQVQPYPFIINHLLGLIYAYATRAKTKPSLDMQLMLKIEWMLTQHNLQGLSCLGMCLV